MGSDITKGELSRVRFSKKSASTQDFRVLVLLTLEDYLPLSR